MNTETIITELRRINAWRRGDKTIAQPEPKHFGEVLEAAAGSLASLIARNTTLRRERSEARAEVAQLKGALALGQENCDAEYNELREERDWAQARVEELEAEAERNAWTISPEMVQTRNDQLAAENAALRARVAELVAALQSIAAGDGDERRRAEDALARAESATPAKHPDTEFWQPASTAPENAKDVLAYYQGVYGPCLGFLSGKRFHPYGSSGSEPFTHWARVPAIDAARKQGGAT